MTYRYLIALGSSLGDRRFAIDHALTLMSEKIGRVLEVSKMYETKPVGNAKEMFINAACLVSSVQAPLEVMSSLLKVEEAMGRKRDIHWGDRNIDLDIILAKDPQNADVVITLPQLTIPHPRATERRFVMEPCADVCADWLFPGQNSTISQILEKLI